MFTVEKLKDLEGASKFGNCNSCGIGSMEDGSLIRIRASVDGRDNSSMCLCGKCAEKLLGKLKIKYGA